MIEMLQHGGRLYKEEIVGGKTKYGKKMLSK